MLIHRIKGIFLKSSVKLAKISCDFFSYRICNCYKANVQTNHFRIVINNRSAGKKTQNENFLILPRVTVPGGGRAGGGGGLLGLIFAGYVPLASQSP